MQEEMKVSKDCFAAFKDIIGPKYWPICNYATFLSYYPNLSTYMEDMDKQIRKIEKGTKKTEKQLKSLEKADKKRDKVCDYGEKMMKKKKK